MKIQDLLREYELEIDDVRWYLSAGIAERLLALRELRHDLIRYIWSGSLADDLYDLEESFLASLEEKRESGLVDEVSVREIMKEIVRSRTQRYNFTSTGGEVTAGDIQREEG